MTAAASADVLVLAEADYRYGSGELRLQAVEFDRSAPVELDGESWVPVSGIRIRRDGRSLGPVRVLVRGSRLPPSTRG